MTNLVLRFLIWSILIFSVFARERPSLAGLTAIQRSHEETSEEAEYANSNDKASWESDFGYGDENGNELRSSSESKQTEVATNDDSDGDEETASTSTTIGRNVRLEPFNESAYLERMAENKIPLITDCSSDDRLVVHVPRIVFGSATNDSLFVLPACQLGTEFNATHLLLNISYHIFVDVDQNRRDSPCGEYLRSIRYEKGVAYVVEIPVESHKAASKSIQIVTLSTYCYFDKPKMDVTGYSWIDIYVNSYDRQPVASRWMHLSSNAQVYLEIKTYDGPKSMKNVPVNCWLSTRMLANESSRDMADSLFLKDGCPLHVSMVTRTKTGNWRVGFSVSSFKGDLKPTSALYTHCQFVRCDGGDGRGVGKLPPCPELNSCANQRPLKYRSTEMSVATSSVVVFVSQRPPQPIVVPGAGGASMSKKTPSSENMEKTTCHPLVPWWMFFFIAVASFLIGIALMLLLGWIRSMKISARSPTSNDMATSITNTLPIKESSVGNFSTMTSGGGGGKDDDDRNDNGNFSAQQPDVLAATPDTKRVHLCKPSTTSNNNRRGGNSRQRHMAGHNGYQPDHAADSVHDYSRTGADAIALKDASWNRKMANCPDGAV